MADGSRHFYAYRLCGELIKTALDVHRCQFNLFGSAVPRVFAPSVSVPLRVRRASPVPLACLVDDVVPSSYSVPLMPALS